MIDPELRMNIRHYFYAQHWKIGTIASELGVHPDTVKRAIEAERFYPAGRLRPSILDEFIPFLSQVLERHPHVCATRLYQMIKDRGYKGSVVQLRRVVKRLRPQPKEAFLSLNVFPGEQAQVDWAHFGAVMVGRARRQLSCFVMTLSWSRAVYLEFFFDQTTENFLRGHVNAFQSFSGAPREILYDNLKSAVQQRLGSKIQFNPKLLDLASHYHFMPRPVQVRAGNQKGRVERTIQYVRTSYWAARPFTTLEECNRQALQWRDEVAHQRPWPSYKAQKVATKLEEERSRLLRLPQHPFYTDRKVEVHPGKTIYVRFDLNDYSIPPEASGQPLTLYASPTQVRILYGGTEVARHARSYDRQQQILEPAHQEALLKTRRKALEATRSGRLGQAVPESTALLEQAFEKGESVTRQTTHLLDLLDRYGAQAVRAAVIEALKRDTPRAAQVEWLLRRRDAGRPQPVDLSRHPEAQSLDVQPHDLETYDELANSRDKKPKS
jgi:transposase